MKFYLIFVFILFVHSCNEYSGNNTQKKRLDVSKDKNDLDSLKKSDKPLLTLDNITYNDKKLGNVLFKGIKTNEFSIERKGDTIFIKKQGYAGLENLRIEFESKKNIESIKGKIVYGASQMTYDDIPAPNFLNFSMTDTVSIIKENHSYFEIGKHIYEFSKLVSVFQVRHFNEIKNESYDYQLNFYKEQVNNTSLRECCPEYIDQAREFLEMKITDFRTIDDLHVEPYLKKIVLELESNTWLVFYNY